MSELLGSIHDPDVVFTDIGLAILAGYLARRLWMVSGDPALPRTGALLLGALASAAFWGALFHAFFPAGTATRSGSVAWSPVVLSIVAAAVVMLELSLRILAPRLPAANRRWMVTTYAAAFVTVSLLDHSFTSIVYFYLPALFLLLLAAWRQAIRNRGGGWTLITIGLLLSAGAATLQQARVAIHPVYFDHNAVYHGVQSIAILFLYFGWRQASRMSSSLRAES